REARDQLPSPSPHLIFTGLQAQTPVLKERQPERSTLYVQCPYTPHTNYQEPKAWCHLRNGQWEPLVETTYSTRCTKQATKGKVRIEDNCTNRIMTITITNLQVEDSGTYSCAYYSYYSYGYVLLKTISLTVFKELYKQELDSVSVQCPYGTAVDGIPVHSTDIKAWCRLDRTWCNILGRTDNPSTQNHMKAQQGRVSIQDDTEKRTVTITMQKLQARDTGVYQCVLYTHTHLIPIREVKLSVSKREYLLAAKCRCWRISAPPPLLVLPPVLRHRMLGIPWTSVLLTPLVLVHSKGTRQAEDIYDKPEDTAQLDSTDRMESPQDDSKDLKYVTLNFKSRLSLEDPLYCNVEPSQAHRKPKDEYVEYATIALK
ncbi:TREM1 protein, partial [Alopecoenas beccarii]|nr:TREM1 protein [Alopecoenas beccarii]